MYKKLLFSIAIGLITIGCGNKNGSDTYKEKSDVSDKYEDISDKVEVTVVNTGFTARRATIFYPEAIIKVKNISSENLMSIIVVEVLFINKTTNEQLDFDINYIDNPFKPGMSKSITMKSLEGLTYLGKDFESMLENSNISCEIYINNRFYTEIKIDGKLLIY